MVLHQWLIGHVGPVQCSVLTFCFPEREQQNCCDGHKQEIMIQNLTYKSFQLRNN